MRSRYIAICALHQLKKPGYRFDQLGLMRHSNNKITTSSKAIYSSGTEDTIDCCIFDFTTSVQDGSLEPTSWYDLAVDIGKDYTPEPLNVLAIGYPGHRNSIDYENKKYGASPSAVWGYQTANSMRNRLAFRVDPEINFDPFGMSGSPVFVIKLNDLIPEVFLCGIVTNASRTKFHFTPLKNIRKLIEDVFN